MNSKKISTSSSKSKLASKDLSRSIPKNDLDKLQIEYKSNSSSKLKDISNIWKSIFKSLFSFLKSKVSSPLLAEIQYFLKEEINKIKFFNPNLKSKDSDETIEEILKYTANTDINKNNSISIETKPSNDSNKEKEDRKSSKERENFIKIKENEHSLANPKQYLLNLNLNKITAEGTSNIKYINNYTEQPSKTNLNNKTAKTIPKQSYNIRDIAKINSSQNYSKPKDKYVSPQNSQLLIANRLNQNLQKLGSKTNSLSRSISKSKDSISLTKNKKSLADLSSVKQIGVSISNSNNEDLIAANKQNTNLSNLKIPKTRGFKSSNMFSKINTRLKTKTGLSPDDINLKREKISNVFYPIEDNNLKISNPLEYNPLAKQIESLTNKIKTSQNRDNDKKLSYAYNIVNVKSDVHERKYSSNLKNSSQKLPEKPSLNKNFKIGSNYNSISKHDFMDKKISHTNLVGIIPADLKLNHHNSFTGNEIDALKETGNSRSKINPNQHRIIDLTFGNKETSTGRFMSEERRLITSNMDNCEDKENIISELFKEVKLNLDGNMKNIFNFSYENFNNENSESVISYIKTDNSDVSEGRKDELIKVRYDVNEIGFDESEEKLKNILFKRDIK